MQRTVSLANFAGLALASLRDDSDGLTYFPELTAFRLIPYCRAVMPTNREKGRANANPCFLHDTVIAA